MHNFLNNKTAVHHGPNWGLLALSLLMVAAPTHAADLSGIFGGVTDTLKSVVRLLIYDWGYYIGIAALALQGYRWWAGHITMMDFLKWSVGIVFVFFAPSIVDTIRSNAGRL